MIASQLVSSIVYFTDCVAAYFICGSGAQGDALMHAKIFWDRVPHTQARK